MVDEEQAAASWAAEGMGPMVTEAAAELPGAQMSRVVARKKWRGGRIALMVSSALERRAGCSGHQRSAWLKLGLGQTDRNP